MEKNDLILVLTSNDVPMKKPTVLLLRQLFFLAFCLPFCLVATAQKDSLPNKLTISYDYTHFDRQFADDWQVASLEYSRTTGFGALLGRLNQATRFGRQGWQFEGEAYPVISKKLYAFAGVSYADAVPVFPKWRTGTTLYYNFAKSWEAEGGFRYLYFDRSIWMGTAGVSKYMGNWLLNVRSFFSIDAPVSSQSFFFKAQRFLKNENDYVWLQAGSGVSPDESRNVQLSTSSNLVSKRFTAGAKLSLLRQWQLALSAGYARDEYRTKTFGHQYNGTVGVSYLFN